MSLADCGKPCHLGLGILKSNLAQVENIAQRGSLELLHLTPLEKITMFLVGMSVKSRCFKHVQNLPCRYRLFFKK